MRLKNIPKNLTLSANNREASAMMNTSKLRYGILVRLEIVNKPGMLGRVTSAIGRAGGDIGAIDIAGFREGRIIRDLTITAANSEMEHRIVESLKKISGIDVIRVADRTFMAHHGGKIEIRNKLPLKTRADLSTVYTPGVARVSMAIHENPDRAYELTIKRNTIAIVTDGTAVLGLGDIGPAAAMPVMEGKAMLFKAFGGVNAFPICLDTRDPDEIVNAVKWISPGFGGINLEDISAPRCFEIEARLKKDLDIPVFHDDQHGTAVVILAGLINALEIVGKRLEDITVVVNGLGAAGVAAIRLLLSSGVKRITGCDRSGALYRGRQENMNPVKEEIANLTNPDGIKGPLTRAIRGADVFLGLSQPDVIHARDIRKMAADPIVFAMANPIPEIMPEEAQKYARVVATGRSDYCNQINNVLCFPGLFRGVLDCHARDINEDMLLAAAHAIASCVNAQELREDYIIPSIFDRQVQERVARAVTETTIRTGAARAEHPFFTL
jgi:malate dehydrogenase (oxaloacetate-decarboxylating)